MNKAERKEISTILFAASEVLRKNLEIRGCCGAFMNLKRRFPDIFDGKSVDKAERLFQRMFQRGAQRLDHDAAYWFEESLEFYSSPEARREVRTRRILGLLFCAYLVEIGEWE